MFWVKKVFRVKKVFWVKKSFLGQNSFLGLPPTPLPPSPTNFRKYYPDLKLKNNWGPLSSTFHIEQPGTLIEWNFKSMTYGLTWVGARDACASKKFGPKIFVLVFLLIKKIILLVFFYIYKIYSHHVLDGYTK